MVRPDDGGSHAADQNNESGARCAGARLRHNGSIEWSGDTARAQQLFHVDFVVSVSTAAAAESRGAVRRASCTLVHYYVARYTAAVAGYFKPQLTAQLNHVVDWTDQGYRHVFSAVPARRRRF
jgi:hypothetical protein